MFWTQTGGAAFLVLDLTLVAPIFKTAGVMLAKGGANVGTRLSLAGLTEVSEQVVKGGAVFSTDAAVDVGIKQVSKGGGTAAQKEAVDFLGEMLVKQEFAMASSEVAVRQSLLKASRNSTVVISGTTGKQNHAVTYVIHEGIRYKIHGSMKLFAEKVVETSAREWLEKGAVKNFNTMTIYTADHLSRIGLTDAAIMKIVKEWGARSHGFVNTMRNVCGATGCGSSQAYFLRQLGVHSERGMGRYLPYLMDKSRMAGNGFHYVFNGGRQLSGTTAQAFMGLGFPQVMKAGGTTYNIVHNSMVDPFAIPTIRDSDQVVYMNNPKPINVGGTKQTAQMPTNMMPGGDMLLVERVSEIDLDGKGPFPNNLFLHFPK